MTLFYPYFCRDFGKPECGTLQFWYYWINPTTGLLEYSGATTIRYIKMLLKSAIKSALHQNSWAKARFIRENVPSLVNLHCNMLVLFNQSLSLIVLQPFQANGLCQFTSAVEIQKTCPAQDSIYQGKQRLPLLAHHINLKKRCSV